MASRYYGINLGQTKIDVVEGSSSGTKAVEIQVDLTKVTADSTGQQEVLKLLENLKLYIISKAKWPPA